MELESKLGEIGKVVREHREVLLTEEAAKNALVMPFLQALGYNVFNPSEVIPEFTCDVGTKRGEKVDYAICNDNAISILVECKPANSELNINHASQLFRYFSVTEARFAILTNGVVYNFYSDLDTPKKMDAKPFFTFQLDALESSDVRTLTSFAKNNFSIEQITAEAANLKLQSLVAKELEKEFADPSEDLVRLIATRVHEGRFTSNIKDSFKALIISSISGLIREKVNERLKSALLVSNPLEVDDPPSPGAEDEGILTTQEEIDGFHIVRAIASRYVGLKRIQMRDAKSYYAVLLDNNNRKTLVRLHFNSHSVKYIGTFHGKDETRHLVANPVDVYQYEKQISERISELVEPPAET